jgi:hypothetical protein
MKAEKGFGTGTRSVQKSVAVPHAPSRAPWYS